MPPPHDGSPSRTTTRTPPTTMPLRPRPARPQPDSEPHKSEQPETDHHTNTPGHPLARGTLPMARYLTDPTTEGEIQALAAEAGSITEDQRARLGRLLRFSER